MIWVVFIGADQLFKRLESAESRQSLKVLLVRDQDRPDSFGFINGVVLAGGDLEELYLFSELLDQTVVEHE
jgi:hypothetical protein